MPSLKDLKTRITSVKSTQKITKAKQMVAAAKLRRAEERATEAPPYTERMEAVLANLASSAEGNPNAPKLLAGTGEDKTHLLIVATADKGLCGGFNSSIVRLAREEIVRLQGEGKKVKLVCVGRKGYEQLKRLYSELVVWRTDFTEVRQIGFGEANEIASKVLELFEADEFDVATLFYGKFKNVVSQVPTPQQIIPAVAPEGVEPPDLKGAVYEYEPDEADILKVLLPRYVAVQIFRALLENVASEQAASMTAMDNATRNAGEMIDKLNLQYNRARQAQITTELIEIIAGAEAL
ncbi:MAG: F0F1 ATP synthase subunit gamma [Marinicaulis sp.]|nr:F0F1 ATP synthase subunit gamma [Marinicaulis sp.]